MKRTLSLAVLVLSSACASGSHETRREAAATASTEALRPASEQAAAPVANAGEGAWSRAYGERQGRMAQRGHRARGEYTVDGRVAGLEEGDHPSVRIAREGAAATELRIADDTRVLRDGREVKLGDLREGDEVRASFELRGDGPTATELRVTPGAAAK